MSLFLICTGDNLSKLIGWDISAHTPQGGRDPIADEPEGGMVHTGLLKGWRENDNVQHVSEEADWVTVTAPTSHVSVF